VNFEDFDLSYTTVFIRCEPDVGIDRMAHEFPVVRWLLKGSVNQSLIALATLGTILAHINLV
jgi:hypothetical protein